MREIKFRAWQKTHNKMLFDWCGQLINAMKEPSERIILMQYTGLKDKNGKEIYEGDIILVQKRYKGKRNGKEQIVVTWVETPFHVGFNLSSKGEYEIIGNIIEITEDSEE